MIDIDPFITKSDALKVIIKGDFDHDTLAGYVAKLNAPIDECSLKEYFIEVYKRFPNDFKIVVNNISRLTQHENTSLMFMNVIVASIPFTVATIEAFFDEWYEPEVNGNDILRYLMMYRT